MDLFLTESFSCLANHQWRCHRCCWWVPEGLGRRVSFWRDKQTGTELEKVHWGKGRLYWEIMTQFLLLVIPKVQGLRTFWLSLICRPCIPYLSKYSDRQAQANTYSVDPDQILQNVASDQHLQCLPLIQQNLNRLWNGMLTLIMLNKLSCHTHF